MFRWIRIASVGGVVLLTIGVGVLVGLFLRANSGWVPVNVPEWLEWIFGDRPFETWIPLLLAGWILAVLGLGAMLLWSMYYVWRRRQYESLIARLEKELAALRNLPFTHPAPLEDLPELPDEDAARQLAAAATDADAARVEDDRDDRELFG